MSKLKKIVSVILAVTMLMTVAPVSMFASAADYVYGDAPTYTYEPFYVDTSETDEVVRVASKGSPFVYGHDVVATTPSGVPDGGTNLSAAGLAGEAVDFPSVVFKIIGVEKKTDIEIVSVASDCGVSINNTATESETTLNGKKVYRYSYKVTGGTATANTDVTWTITYKVDGVQYTANAYMRAENILRAPGFAWHTHRASGTGLTGKYCYGETVATLQGKNMYPAWHPGTSSFDRGYINFAADGTNMDGDVLSGLGNQDAIGTDTSGFAVATTNDAEASIVKIKTKANATTGHGDKGTGYDGNRPYAKVYMDINEGENSVEALNIRQVLMSAESANTDAVGLTGYWVTTHNTDPDNDGAGVSNWNRSTQPAQFKPKAIYNITGTQNTASYPQNDPANPTNPIPFTNDSDDNGNMDPLNENPRGEWMMVKFTGSQFTSTGTFPYRLSNYIFHHNHKSKDKYEANGRMGMSVHFYVYNTVDLQTIYNKIQEGHMFSAAGTYPSYTTTQLGSGNEKTITFNKGINPRASMYTSSTWSVFADAYATAGKLLQQPNVDQAAVNTATTNLITAYTDLAMAITDPVPIRINYYISGTETPVAPSLTTTTTPATISAPAGSMVTAHALKSITGYTLVGQNTKEEQVDGTTPEYAFTFYYTPNKYKVTIYANNDINGDGVADANDKVEYSDKNYGSSFDLTSTYADLGTKQYYVLEGIYEDAALTKKYSDTITITKPTTGYAKWVTAPINIYVDPVGTGAAAQKIGSVTPNEDPEAPVNFNKPATDPAVSGYVFTGYYTDSALTTAVKWPLQFVIGDSDRTIYGRFVDVNGKIVFESNGGTSVPDQSFQLNGTIQAPDTVPTKEGYTFAGWYKDKECVSQPVEWGTTMTSNVGFVAYAKWTPNLNKIYFELDNDTKTPYDTQEIAYIEGPSDEAIPSEKIPPEPRRFKYEFDGWKYNNNGVIEDYTFDKYPTKDITVVATWREVDDSALINIDALEDLSGNYVEVSKAQKGDVITFRMTSMTNFFVGSSLFVFMYDKNFYEPVTTSGTVFKLNTENEYVSGVNAQFTEVTDSSLLEARWPSDIESAKSTYSAMQIAIDPTVTVDDYTVAPMSQDLWLVEFQLRIKDTASGSGTVYMDNKWTRTLVNPMGTMFYGWAEKANDAVFNTENDKVTPDLTHATATVTIDENPPVETTVNLNAAPGAFADGATKTYTGRAEKPIENYVSPTRYNYELTKWVNADATSDYKEWAEGYYAKAGYSADLTFNAVWEPVPFPVTFFAEKGAEPYEQNQVGYEQQITAPQKNPAKKGYVFAGWADENGTVYETLPTVPDGGINFYAKWDPATNTPYKIEVYMTFDGVESVYHTIDKTGTTDSEVQIVTAVPDAPVEGVTYITIEEIESEGMLSDTELDKDDTRNALPMTGTIDPEGTLVFKLYFEGETVTVTFDANGGAFPDGDTEKTTSGRIGQDILNAPEQNPEKYGYDFIEWEFFWEDDYFYGPETYKAVWEPVQTNIRFMAEDADGNWTEVSVIPTAFGSVPKAPQAPEKTGWIFKGWKTSEDATDYVTTLPAVDKIDDETGIAITYYAHYELSEIAVTYKLDGEVKYTEKHYIGDTVVIRPAETKTGYDFSGWKINGADATDFVMSNQEVVIEGFFTAKTIGVIFNANGGTFADGKEDNTVNTEFNSTINLPVAPPERAGYTFKGWVDTPPAENVTSGSTSLGTLTKESAEYYAVWEANTVNYYIDVYVMNADGTYPATPETITLTAKVDSEVSYNPEAKTGFTVDSVVSGTVPAPVDGAELRLEVRYQRNQWNLILMMDGNEVGRVPYYYDQATTTPEGPDKTGYSFTGWTPAVPGKMPNNNVTLEAVMVPNKYPVVFDYAGGIHAGVTSTEVQLDFGSVIEVPIDTNALVNEGHSFSHWVIAGTETKVEFTETTPVVPLNGITFEAVWTVNSYNIVYKKNSADSGITIPVPYGTTLEEIKADYAPEEALNPTLEGNTFDGWDWSSIGTSMPARNVDVYAKWKVNTYEITFNENGGTSVTDIKLPYNTEILFNEVTTKTGYQFDYWYYTDENTKYEIPEIMPALDLVEADGSIELTAHWTVKEYTITFDSDGGSAVAPITAVFDADIAAPAAPEKKGYTFGGWYYGTETTEFAIGPKMPAIDELYGEYEIALKAKWNVKTITITFDSNGGSAVAPIEAQYDTYIGNKKPANPTLEGYTFTGWTLDGAPYTIPETMDIDEDIIVVATWEINTYTISFNSAGGSAVDPITAQFGDPISKPADPTRTGYTFQYWYYQTNTEPFEFGSTMPALDVKYGVDNKELTLNAYWTVNQYTITFDTAGGSAIDPITKNYNAAIVRPANPTRDGYEFKGWDVEIPVKMPAENMTITALWDANEYTISFEENGGSEVKDITADYDTDITAPDAPTKKGHTFEYWYEKDSEGTPFVFNKMPLGGKTLYAKWDAIEYTININANGGTKQDGSAIENIVQDYGTAVTDPGTPYKEGYTFDGWYIVGGDKYTFPATMPDENVNIEAKWTINTYEVIFYNYNGTEYTEYNKTTPEFGTAITAPENDPAREHYIFVGWSLTNDPSDDETEVPYDFATEKPTVPVGGMKFYPIYKRVEVKLELIAGSSARVTTDKATDVITGYIYGIAAKTRETKLRDEYLAVTGDGELLVTPTKFNLCGTGTKVEVYDNVIDKVVETYYIVIFGDINGDSGIDATDVSMLVNEDFGNTNWSYEDASNDNYAYYRILAADLNGDTLLDGTDISLLRDVSLYDAKIKQEVELTTDVKIF